jgi:nitrite reductase (NADH) large subunit
VLAIVDGRAEAIRITGVFMQYYRENAKWLERTYDFVPRVGLDELKALLVEDRDGIVGALEERIQTAVDAYADPWGEGRTPVTDGQFADALPLIPLPLVPVRDGSSSPAGVDGTPADEAPVDGAMA